MSGYDLPWWAKVILAPAVVAWKIKNTFKGKEKELPEDKKKEEPKKEDVDDPRNRY